MGLSPVANSDCLSHLFSFKTPQRRDKVASGHVWYFDGTQFSQQCHWYKMRTTECAQHAQCRAMTRTRAEQWTCVSGVWFGSGCRTQGAAQAGMANG